MNRPKNVPLKDIDQKYLDDEGLKKTFLEGVEELAKEAGDWRNHLPYEALLGYRKYRVIRVQFEDHVNACKYCQELMDTLSPLDKA